MNRQVSLGVRLLLLLAPALFGVTEAQALESCIGGAALRAGAGPAEWSDSPRVALPQLVCRLDAGPNTGPATLLLQQDGVKRADWKVTLNDKSLGSLLADEHKQTRVFEVPAGLLRAEGNELRIEAGDSAKGTDDIQIGGIRLVAEPLASWLAASRVQVRIVDDSGKTIPARITIADKQQTLQPVGAHSGGDLAVRMGVVYSSSGSAEFTLPAGAYTVWASRGFAYSAQHQELTVKTGSEHRLEFRLRREVEIPEWTAGDTHLHTFERSGHGDATVDEQSITVAGEGLDWAVSTEHNRPETISSLGGLFVPIRGVEFTTKYGHFNLFPWRQGASIPDPGAPWQEVWQTLPVGKNMVAIWNHPRDTHSDYRPFDPTHYVELAAESLDGRVFVGNGMEVVNSGAMYTQPLLLVTDWMRHLNRGAQISAVGSSDSHTVTTSLVGQGRTYVHSGAGPLTPAAVASAFSRGETAVSYGLAAFLERRGDALVARVYGPSWNRAKRLIVFSNGEQIAEIAIDGAPAGGLQWEGEIKPPVLRQDAYLAVAAVGGDPAVPFWPLNRSYQPVSPQWEPMTLGVSPALAWDGNADGRFQNARELAEGILKHASEPADIVTALAQHDLAVAAQAGLLLVREGRLDAVLAATGPETPGPMQERFRAVKAAENFAANQRIGADKPVASR